MHRRLTPGLLAALIVFSGSALAQQTGTPTPGGPGTGRQAFPYPNLPDEPTITEVNFPGGTVQQYVDYLRSVAPNNTVNVVITGDVGRATIPAVNLKGVTVTQAVEFLPGVAEGPRAVTIDANRNRVGTPGVFTLRYQTTGNPLMDSPPPISIFQISDLIRPDDNSGSSLASGTLPVNTILTAIENAVTMVGGPRPEVKFHAESGVLLMKGSQPQMDATRDILFNLRESTGRVDSLGGGSSTQTFALAHRPPEDIVQAFRDVFPAGSPQAAALKVEAVPATNSVVIKVPRNMALAAEVLVRYVDRVSVPSADVLEAHARVEAANVQNQQLGAHISRLTDEILRTRQEQARDAAGYQAQVEILEKRVKMLTTELEQENTKK